MTWDDGDKTNPFRVVPEGPLPTRPDCFVPQDDPLRSANVVGYSVVAVVGAGLGFVVGLVVRGFAC